MSSTRKIKIPDLPIHAVESEIVEAVTNNRMLVITGDTGSGKSTQLAQFLHHAGYKRIAVTQPRRVGVRCFCKVYEYLYKNNLIF